MTRTRRRVEQRPGGGSRVVFLVWRDTGHPDGGGSEVYVERMAAWLAANDHDVTIVCAEHGNAPRDEVRDGVRFRRRGGRLTVYPRGLAYLRTRSGRQADIVVDVQNGLPFFSPLVRRRAVLVLVHHVHREQWQIIYPGPRGRIGWWIESTLSPRVYRGRDYLTVSSASASDLVELGVPPDRVHIVHNGIDVPHPSRRGPRASVPTLCVLGRLVPHKQVEHALHVVAALRDQVRGIRLEIIGDGWWRENLEREAAALGVGDLVTFHGRVDGAARDAALDRAWVMLAPSVKEGWGIAIMEAAARGVPTIAYSSGGGVCESVLNGHTGLLVDDLPEMVSAANLLLSDAELRTGMGNAARERATDFDWPSSAAKLARLLEQQSQFAQRVP